MMQININFLSPVKIIKKVILKKLIKNYGHICVTSSMVTLANGGVNMSSYSSSKYAIKGYMNCLRQ
jgi:short-subunit dehydrogenase